MYFRRRSRRCVFSENETRIAGQLFQSLKENLRILTWQASAITRDWRTGFRRPHPSRLHLRKRNNADLPGV
jgi:hypothetical protein